MLRQKLLTLCDGEWQRLQYILFHLNKLVEAEAVATWLIRHGLKGRTLADWVDEKFDGMFLPMFDHVRAQACRQNTGKAVILGRDINV